MKYKFSRHWYYHALLLSDQSPCCRGAVGAVIIDSSNNPISMGYNGPPRGADGFLCTGDTCERNEKKVKSGTQIEIGCHHAEANVLMNAVKKGIAVDQCSLEYDRRGQEYLEKNHVSVYLIDLIKEE
jgi:dCMP deaminase